MISPVIDRLYWGSFTQAQINTQEAYLTALVAFINNQGVQPGQEPTVRQYGVWGASMGTLATDSSTPTGAQSQTAIRNKIAACQQAGSVCPLPAYAPQRVVMVFTQGIQMDSNYGALTASGWCGYHTTAGTNKFWAIIPNPTGNCNVTGAFQGATSHEVIEAATDPDLTNGWCGTSCPADEVADGVCNGTWTSMALPNGVTGFVQPIADNIQGNCSITTVEEDAPLAATASDSTAGVNSVIEVMARGSDGALKTVSGDGINWGSVQNLGGIITEAPAIVTWGPFHTNRTVVVRGLDGGLYAMNKGVNWPSGFQSLGAVTVGPPSIVKWTNPNTSADQVNVFVRGTDGGLYSFWTTDGVSWFNGFVGLPSGVTMISPPRTVSRSTSAFDVFFTATNAHLYQISWNGFGWSAFKDLGRQGVFLSGYAAPSGSTRLDVFPRGQDNGVYWKRLSSNNGFVPLGGVIVGTPTAAALGTTGGATIDVFARGQGGLGGGTLWMVQSINSGSSWAWSQIDSTLISGGATSVLWGSSLNNVSVFVRRTDGTLGHKSSNGSGFNSMQNLGGSIM